VLPNRLVGEHLGALACRGGALARRGGVYRSWRRSSGHGAIGSGAASGERGGSGRGDGAVGGD
jgi:hypothetical protein